MIALSACVALGPMARGADSPKKNSSQQTTDKKQPARPDRLKTLTSRLSLTPDQVEKIKPILQEEQTRMKALREDKALSREQRTAKLRDIRQETFAKIKPVLTPEQQEKFDKMEKQQTRPRRQNRAKETK